MRRRHTLCVAIAKLSCAVRRFAPASTAGLSGVQGLAFLVTFTAIGKSGWPRAAPVVRGWHAFMDRHAHHEGETQYISFQRPLALALSREERGHNASPAQKGLVNSP